jgi:hypothetical protein
MKRILLGCLLLAALVAPLRAAEDALSQFRAGDFRSYSKWFSDARSGPSGGLVLEATNAFMNLPGMMQNGIVQKALLSWYEAVGSRAFKARPIVTIETSRGGSLWTMDERTQRVRRVESWDTLRPGMAGSNAATGKFFTYLGGGMRAVDKILNVNVEARVGSYLFRRILDSSLNVGMGAVTSLEEGSNGGTLVMTVGGMMRFHFPLVPQVGLRGNVGGGADLVMNLNTSSSSYGSSSTTTTDVTGYGLAGLSKMIGRSTSVDVSVKIQESPVILFGLTSFFSTPSTSSKK